MQANQRKFISMASSGMVLVLIIKIYIKQGWKSHKVRHENIFKSKLKFRLGKTKEHKIIS